MCIRDSIWTIHLSETRKFIEKVVDKNNFEIVELYEFDYPLKNTMAFHTKETKIENAILYHIASLPK